MMFFKVKPAEGLEKYLGAWGHMLAASDDLIDLIHTHPFLADGGPNMQFNVIFPRAATYRVWVQFQRRAWSIRLTSTSRSKIYIKGICTREDFP